MPHAEVLWVYRISFYWYTLMGAALVILIGFPVSLFTRNTDDDITDERFITPLLRRKSKVLQQANKGYALIHQNENICKGLEMAVVNSTVDTK